MNPNRTRVVLRERALPDILDLGLRFLIEHGGVYARTALVVLPPFFIASMLVARTLGPSAAWFFAIFAAMLAGAPFTVLASRLVFEDEVRIVRVLGEALRAAPRLFVLRILTFGGGWLGFVMFVLPGVWLFAVALFVVEVTVLERSPLRATVWRSARIVGCESGETFLALLLLLLLQVIATLSVDSAGRMIISVLLESRAPAPIWTDGWSTLSLLGFWLFVPYVATARFFVYLDVRTRSEGWDIQTRFVALATRASLETRSAA
jgi:hypothetical protein